MSQKSYRMWITIWLNMFLLLCEALQACFTELRPHSLHISQSSTPFLSLTSLIFDLQLELSYNPIGADGSKILADFIKFHGNVQTLRLGWCQVKISFGIWCVYLVFEKQVHFVWRYNWHLADWCQRCTTSCWSFAVQQHYLYLRFACKQPGWWRTFQSSCLHLPLDGF